MIEYLIAFGAGLISFLSPCVLPLIPGYISYISGQSLQEILNKKQTNIFPLVLFCLGFSTVFVILGASASFLGQALLQNSEILRILAGIIIVIFSLQLIGIINISYLNFEKRFDVNVLGAFTVSTDVMPGAEQLAEIREIIEHDKVSCIFSEPQFNPDIINAVAKDMDIQTGVLDPLGATLDPGKDLYFDLIKNMSKSFKGC